MDLIYLIFLIPEKQIINDLENLCSKWHCSPKLYKLDHPQSKLHYLFLSAARIKAMEDKLKLELWQYL